MPGMSLDHQRVEIKPKHVILIFLPFLKLKKKRNS